MFSRISVSGLSVDYALLTADTKNLTEAVYLYDRKFAHINACIRDSLKGGPALVFHRRHEAGKTVLREKEQLAEHSVCQSIASYDASSQYLGTTGMAMPCGPVRVYNMNKDYIFTGDRQDQSPFPDGNTTQSTEALEWLTWLAAQRTPGTFRHALTLEGEAKIGPRQIPVDGFDATDSTIYQYHGCYTHSCYCKRPPRTKNERFTAWCSKRYHSDRMDAYMRRFAPGKLVIMYACEWVEIKKRTPAVGREARRLLQEKTLHPPLLAFKSKTAESMAREVTKLIADEVLFGMVMVDIEVPKHLREYYKDMQVKRLIQIFLGLAVCRY